MCTGDCDHDGQCTEGLACFGRSDLTPVPGCAGDGVSGEDYCFPLEDAPSNQLIHTGDCTATSPCGECQGDCDDHSQCATGLLCKERTNLEDVPGCVGYGVRGKDYCYNPANEPSASPSVPLPALVTQATDCTSTAKCGLCTGDCDHDRHCEEGYVCFDRSDAAPVPGCGGTGVSGKDYCYPVEEAPSNQLIHIGDCSSSSQCGECYGDCDSDSQCEGTLRCAKRSDLEDVPGCAGMGWRSKDYCYDPTKCVPSGGKCSSSTADLCCSDICMGDGTCS